MNVIRYIRDWFAGMGRVFRREFRLVTKDVGVLLFFIFLPLVYPVIYTIIYNPEVVRKLPVAVVDESMSADSRELIRKASAQPTFDIYAIVPNMADAKQLMAENKVFGVMKITHDYARNLRMGRQGHVEFYSDMSLLLRYRAFVAALTDLQIEMISSVTGEKIEATGLGSLAKNGDAMPIKSESNFLGDTEQGFASFVIPGIVILILQQSMLLGITLLGGTSRERRRRFGYDPMQVRGVSVSATVWGKALCYTVFYFPLTVYILRFIPEMFNLPHYGRPVDYLLFVAPMLLATAFMGQALNYFMKERESSFVIIVFTSVIFLFLSGLTWPRYAMSDLWTWAGNCIPAVWGVEGFIRINSNASTLPEVARDYVAIWILAAVYMVAACIVTKVICRKDTAER